PYVFERIQCLSSDECEEETYVGLVRQRLEFWLFAQATAVCLRKIPRPLCCAVKRLPVFRLDVTSLCNVPEIRCPAQPEIFRRPVCNCREHGAHEVPLQMGG